MVLSVLPPASRPDPPVGPTGLVFVGTAGGPNPDAQTVTVSNLTSAPVSFTFTSISHGANWFTASPAGGTVSPNQPLQISIRPNITGLAAGVRTGRLTLQFPDAVTRTVDLLLVLAPAPRPSQAVLQSACAPTKLLPLFTQLGSIQQLGVQRLGHIVRSTSPHEDT